MGETESFQFNVLSQEDQLMNAIRDLIFREKKEFKDITIMDICNKANISRRTFYRYYKNKHELMYDMTMHDLDGFEYIIDQIVESNESPIEKLRKIQKQLMKTFFEDFTENVIDHFKIEAPDFWDINTKRYGNIIKKITIVVEQGMEEGVFKKNVDPNLVLFFLYCCSESNGTINVIPEMKLTRSQLINEVFQILLYGIVDEK